VCSRKRSIGRQNGPRREQITLGMKLSLSLSLSLSPSLSLSLSLSLVREQRLQYEDESSAELERIVFD